jgi:HAD superfamily phosphoserine phosphatase-like hydrolase
MDLNKRIVVFDFCETLVDFQSADKFIDFIIAKENYKKYVVLNTLTKILIKLRFLAIVSKFFPELNLSKRLKLYQIKGVSKIAIDALAIQYYNEVLIHHKIKHLHELLLKHIDNKDHILIVSGGYAPYIKYFSEIYKLQYSFATEIEFHNNRATGMFFGKDCLFSQKVVLMETYLKEIKILFEESIAYSDSITDLPLLRWADKAYVVSKGKSQEWAKANGFNEIIWQND